MLQVFHELRTKYILCSDNQIQLSKYNIDYLKYLTQITSGSYTYPLEIRYLLKALILT